MSGASAATFLIAASCAFGQCTTFTVKDDRSFVSIDCYRDGPLSAREIMRNYLKLNPAPVLMVVRAFGNRETWSEYKEKIGISDIDQVR